MRLTPQEKERRKRIRVLLAAYAYEIAAAPIMSDAEFDALAQSIDVFESTGRNDLDAWFIVNFDPDTGQWVHSFPELDKLAACYERVKHHYK